MTNVGKFPFYGVQFNLIFGYYIGLYFYGYVDCMIALFL